MKTLNLLLTILCMLGLMLTLPLVAAAQSTSRPSVAQVEGYIKGSALLGFEWVDQPLNRVLLIRNERSTCAIRFLSYHSESNARSPTAFDTGDASQFATFEVAELNFKGTETLIGPVERRELDYHGLRGLGRLAFGVGKNDIPCGRNRYSWLFPTGLLLKKDQDGTSIAPTNWTSFNSVRLDNPKLRWYQRDPLQQRPFVILTKDELAP